MYMYRPKVHIYMYMYISYLHSHLTPFTAQAHIQYTVNDATYYHGNQHLYVTMETVYQHDNLINSPQKQLKRH